MYYNKILFTNSLKGFCCLKYTIYNDLCTYGTIYFVFFYIRKEKKISQKHAVLQQDLNVKKMRGKEGRGVMKKKHYPPPTFSKTTCFQIISSLQNMRKMFEVYSKKICCLKKIICTHSCTRLWHQGIIAISCRIWKQKIQISREKKCA